MDTKPYIQHDPKIGYVYRPGTRLDLKSPAGRPYRLTINEDGLRSDKRYSFSKPSNVFRILAFGDSFCAGQYLNNHERFSEQMEALHPGLEVLNFGLEGTGTDQQLLLFEHYGLRYEFDLVIICPFIDNIRRNRVRYRAAIDPQTKKRVIVPKPKFDLVEGRLELHGVPIPAYKIPLEEAGSDLLQETDFAGSDCNPSIKAQVKSGFNRLFSVFGLKRALYKLMRYEPFTEYGDPYSSSWLLMSAILNRFKELCANKPLVIVPLVYDSYLRYEMKHSYLERFASLAEDGKIYLIDILSYFRRLSANEMRNCFLVDDCHYSPVAHKILAETFITELRNRGLLPCLKSPSFA